MSGKTETSVGVQPPIEVKAPIDVKAPIEVEPSIELQPSVGLDPLVGLEPAIRSAPAIGSEPLRGIASPIELDVSIGGGAGSSAPPGAPCDPSEEAASRRSALQMALARIAEIARSKAGSGAASHGARAIPPRPRAIDVAAIDQQVGRARATYVRTRLAAAKRAAEERGKWVATHPIVPGMTQEQRAQRSAARRDAFSRINAFFREWQDSAHQCLVDDLKALGRLPAELQPDYVPKIRLEFWGRCIRTQRVDRRLKAKDFCRELNLSEATLRRIEKGDHMVAAISYLKAMSRLGLLSRLVPEPPDDLWQVAEEGGGRGRNGGRPGRPRDGPYWRVRRVRSVSPD